MQFWIDRAPDNEGIESDVVDPALIAHRVGVGGRRRDRIDGEALVGALLAYKRVNGCARWSRH